MEIEFITCLQFIGLGLASGGAKIAAQLLALGLYTRWKRYADGRHGYVEACVKMKYHVNRRVIKYNVPRCIVAKLASLEICTWDFHLLWIICHSQLLDNAKRDNKHSQFELRRRHIDL